MLSLSIPPAGFKNDFSVVTDSFLQTPGLPFASVLDAESIEHIFREEAALFAQDDIFSTQIVLWAFLAQTLRDGKGVACASAVADIAAYMLQTGQQPPCGDTGDYCRARAKLSLRALQRLVRASTNPLEAQAPAAWLWKGQHAKLVDGFTFTMPDTEADQEAYSREDLAELYGFRWNVELDIRHIKQTLHLDHVRGKRPAMVQRELWVTLLAYNLIRQVIATAALVHHKPPRHLGFTRACQSLLASWMILATRSCQDRRALYHRLLRDIPTNEVAHRPGCIEPRVLKRRRHRYPLMQRPRAAPE